MKKYKLIGVALMFFIFGFGIRSFDFSNITAEDAWHASKIFGLDFTHEEIDSLIPNLESNRKIFSEIRKAGLTNDVPPALHFNPLPQHYTYPKLKKESQFNNQEEIDLPQNLNELAFYTVKELSYLIKSKKISSVELTRFFLNRLRKYDDQLHFVISYTDKYALDQAQKMDAELKQGKYRGYLHGIPYGAKDLLAKKDYLTTWGAEPYRTQKFDKDATVIKKLEEAGAILIAKTTMGALAWGDVWFGGKTRNPWDPTRGSSGSSAGSGSSVSSGCLPFAIGTETLGSIVSPSTVCGISGLRPTFGRVSRSGAMALSWSMDKIGPMTRSIEDCALVFDAIYGPDGEDISVIDLPFGYNSDLDIKDLNIGYTKNEFDRSYDFHQNDSIVLDVFVSNGIELKPIQLPNSPNITFLLNVEAAAAFDELTRVGKDDKMVRQIRNAWPNVFRQSRFIPAVEYINANRLRTQLIQEMDQMLNDKEIDVYITPSWRSSNLRITNLTGHPSVVVPTGFFDGRPTSITFTGRLYEEYKVLAVAKYFQHRTDYHQRHPEFFK